MRCGVEVLVFVVCVSHGEGEAGYLEAMEVLH